LPTARLDSVRERLNYITTKDSSQTTRRADDPEVAGLFYELDEARSTGRVVKFWSSSRGKEWQPVAKEFRSRTRMVEANDNQWRLITKGVTEIAPRRSSVRVRPARSHNPRSARGRRIKSPVKKPHEAPAGRDRARRAAELREQEDAIVPPEADSKTARLNQKVEEVGTKDAKIRRADGVRRSPCNLNATYG
jgi:hypothetical protein